MVIHTSGCRKECFCPVGGGDAICERLKCDTPMCVNAVQEPDMCCPLCTSGKYSVCKVRNAIRGRIVFCNGGGFLSVKECFQWDRVPSILPMRTKSQGNEVILSTYYHSNLIRTTPLLIEFLLSKFKTKNQLS